jgi:Zn-dependent peptidase ImmA (M78 family)/transcriptional regulator with XRE-family HTH domain
MSDSSPLRDTSEAARQAAALFSARRLKLAREATGLTQTALATQVPLTSAAVSQFETGEARPSGVTLARIADVLDFPIGFFTVGAAPSSLDPLPGNDDADRGFFRSLRSTTVTDRRRALALTQLVHDLTDHLGRAVRLPDIDIPRHLAEPEDDIHAIEEHAAMVRTAWGVQPGPIPDVVGLLERHGIVCARYHTGTHTVDAFSVPFADRPIVILGDDKAKRDRERFSGVHELGHLVMHTSEQAGSKAAEDQANQFAAAFLMPADDIRAELPSSAAWNQLVALKRRWGTSIGSLLRRSKTLDIMADGTYQQAYRYMGARGWRTNEPGDLGAAEAPRLLCQAARQAGISIDSLSDTTGWPGSWIEDVLRASSDQRPQLHL